ncbi:MAG: RNA methyltransferase [Ferruginibacter sp.]|nr:RNA methyltransferase [Ferruginibacter sp.]
MLSKTYTKYIQSLHHKKFRDIENVFIAEGSKVVMELLNSTKIECVHILAKEPWLRENEPEIKKYFNGPLEPVEDYELEKISALSTPSQVVAVFMKLKQGAPDVKGKITLALDDIRDPGNLGTIIRIADWFGVSSIICSDSCADRYNPKVVQSTMGSIARVDMLYTNLVEWLKKNSSLPIYAAALTGKNIASLKGLQEGIILIGNEARGISPEIMQLAKESITIPKFGHAESLNAAVATGIILSHVIASTSPPALSEGEGA